MKKVAIVIASLFAMLTGLKDSSAQRPVGDTIVGMEPTYMYHIYDWWRCANHDPEAPQWFSMTGDAVFALAFSWANQEAHGSHIPNYNGPHPDHGGVSDNAWFQLYPGNNIRGIQMVTDHPIKILGIAACAYAEAPRDTTLWYWLQGISQVYHPEYFFPNQRDTTLAGRLTDSLILYKPTNGEPSYLAGGPWRVEYPHRYLPLPMRVDRLGIPLSNDTVLYTVIDSTPVVPLYEVMFDKPQVVTDSFIVAGTSFNNDGSYETQYLPGNDYVSESMWLWNHPPTRYWSIIYYSNPLIAGWQTPLNHTNGEHVVWFKYRDTPWFRAIPNHYRTPYDTSILYVVHTNVIFPIIDPDFDTTLCDVVRDVSVVAATDTTLTLMWTGGNNVEWEVQYAEVNGWDAWTVTTTVPMVTLTGLHERTNYIVRVRGRCEWDTEFGPWSDWADVFTGAHHDDPPESVSALERFTQMMPNPASGQVTVLSSYRLSRVVVYDLRGHVVLEHDDAGLATTFDVSTLSRGIYVVAIHTPAGTATKRLIVE